MEAADPPALYVSLSYEPTGSKLYTQPLPKKNKNNITSKQLSVLLSVYTGRVCENIPSLSSPARML